MNFALTEEQELIVSTVREFCENEIYPHEDLVERTGEVPDEIAQEITPVSYTHLTLPTIYSV